MCSPQTIGVECPLPGSAAFQRMFLVSLHSTGGLALGATQVPSGPRHCGQSSWVWAVPGVAAVATKRTHVVTRLQRNVCMMFAARSGLCPSVRFYAQTAMGVRMLLPGTKGQPTLQSCHISQQSNREISISC